MRISDWFRRVLFRSQAAEGAHAPRGLWRNRHPGPRRFGNGAWRAVRSRPCRRGTRRHPPARLPPRPREDRLAEGTELRRATGGADQSGSGQKPRARSTPGRWLSGAGGVLAIGRNEAAGVKAEGPEERVVGKKGVG